MLSSRFALEAFAVKSLPNRIRKNIDRACNDLNSCGFDRWGLSPLHLKVAMGFFWFLYKHYFRVKVHGAENIPKDRVMVVANHSGQIPIDAILIATALLDQADPGRVARAMVENWVPTIPFISHLFTKCGQVVGQPNNCLDLLEHDQCVLVFPEGVKGLGKSYAKRYQLQKFGTGFLRMASLANAPILPTAVVGCEEIYPAIFQLDFLAKLIKAPYVPVTPFFPLFGLFGAIPIPSEVNIYFAPLICSHVKKDADEDEVNQKVDLVKSSIASFLPSHRGLFQ